MDIDVFHDLLSPAGQRLLGEVEEELRQGADPLSLGSRLRHRHPPDRVAAALTQARLRSRARAKFGADAAYMYFTPDGLEQATRGGVAAHRARRFRTGPGIHRSYVDFCCGIGGDLVALARTGHRVYAVDRDPLTAAVAEANVTALGVGARVAVRCADLDVAGPVDVAGPPGPDAVFCDPARRAGSTRMLDPATYSPPLARAFELARSAPAGAVKVAPGIPHRVVPPGAEAEWVSDGGELKEAVVWFGELGSGVTRRATLLPSGVTLTGGAGTEKPPVGRPGRYLYDPDPAVTRAGLVGEVAGLVGGALLDSRIAYVTSNALVSTGYARAYEITDVLRFSLKRLRAILRERDVGTVTITKRGSGIDVERLRRQLRLSGSASATVVLTRLADGQHVLLCRPVPG